MKSKPRSLIHLSDLHIGARGEANRRASAIAAALQAADVDHIVVTGDVTNRGKQGEYDTFRRLFEPLWGRMTVIPGNHDCLGDNVAEQMMPRERVEVRVRAGAYFVCVNSTGPHNRFLLSGHGQLTEDDLNAVEVALTEAPPYLLKVVMLHHHPLPLPEERLHERFSTLMGWPYATELSTGKSLLERVAGRCDLVLHGHRHRPHHAIVRHEAHRPVHVMNAGSSTALSAARLFLHVQGELHRDPTWLRLHPPVPVVPVACDAEALLAV